MLTSLKVFLFFYSGHAGVVFLGHRVAKFYKTRRSIKFIFSRHLNRKLPRDAHKLILWRARCYIILKGLRNGLNVTRRCARSIFVGLWLVPLRVAPRFHSMYAFFFFWAGSCFSLDQILLILFLFFNYFHVKFNVNYVYKFYV